jgi:hypothetical protein
MLYFAIYKMVGKTLKQALSSAAKLVNSKKRIWGGA